MSILYMQRKVKYVLLHPLSPFQVCQSVCMFVCICLSVYVCISVCVSVCV